jgi:hypothetical protein
MKILFLTYHGFNSFSGITKKMYAQIKGLRQNGHEVHVCWYAEAEDHNWHRYIDGGSVQNYGHRRIASIKNKYQFGCVYDFCKKNGIELVYARSYINASPFLIHLFRKFKRSGIKSVIEIPTYPYDHEFKSLPIDHKIRLWQDKLFRRSLAKQTNAIVTFSDEKRIFGQRTINISNGIDFDELPIHKNVDCSQEVHLIAVAEVHLWHGLDRLIEGLGQYYQNKKNKRPVYFHIVGRVWETEMYDTKYATGFATHIKKYDIEDYVIFHDRLFGEELNQVFEKCAFAIGSLARHRSGITNIKTLKNREYACRGIPFIYSENDSDFDNQSYILKAPADESPIDIERILHFIDNFSIRPEDIRRTVNHLSWKNQMEIVVKSINQLDKL